MAMRSRKARGTIQIAAGLIQTLGAVLYLALVIGGFQRGSYIVGGVLVLVTLVSFAVFGWPWRKQEQ